MRARIRNAWVATLPAAIVHCVGRIASAGMIVLVVHKTRPGIELPVAQVFTSGLGNLWPSFGMRRRYVCPAELGSREHVGEQVRLPCHVRSLVLIRPCSIAGMRMARPNRTE